MYDNDKQRMIKFKQKNKKKVEPQDIKLKWVQFIVLFQQELNCDSFKQSTVSKVEFVSFRNNARKWSWKFL